MGLLSKAISSLGRVASDKIADKITDAIKGSSSGNAKTLVRKIVFQQHLIILQ